MAEAHKNPIRTEDPNLGPTITKGSNFKENLLDSICEDGDHKGEASGYQGDRQSESTDRPNESQVVNSKDSVDGFELLQVHEDADWTVTGLMLNYIFNILSWFTSLFFCNFPYFTSIPSYIYSYLYGEKFTVGIITMSKRDDCVWMENMLKSPEFTECVNNVQIICPSVKGIDECRETVSSCSFIILYMSRFNQDFMDQVKSHQLESLPLKCGIQNVIVVVGELEDRESEEETRSKWNEHVGELGWELLPFMTEETEYYSEDFTLYKNMGKVEQIKEIMVRGLKTSRKVVGHNKYVVGIFTRQSKCDYHWLQNHLSSSDFQGVVESVRPFYISNSNGDQFREEVSQCTFGILYHSKKRGRLNVTNVTDALYDYELEYLYSTLEQSNVIVVMDDLTDSCYKEKRRTLYTQPSIKQQAKDLILFTEKERDLHYRKPPSPRDAEITASLRGKVEALKEILKKGRTLVEDAAKRARE